MLTVSADRSQAFEPAHRDVPQNTIAGKCGLALTFTRVINQLAGLHI